MIVPIGERFFFFSERAGKKKKPESMTLIKYARSREGGLRGMSLKDPGGSLLVGQSLHLITSTDAVCSAQKGVAIP